MENKDSEHSAPTQPLLRTLLPALGALQADVARVQQLPAQTDAQRHVRRQQIAVVLEAATRFQLQVDAVPSEGDDGIRAEKRLMVTNVDRATAPLERERAAERDANQAPPAAAASGGDDAARIGQAVGAGGDHAGAAVEHPLARGDGDEKDGAQVGAAARRLLLMLLIRGCRSLQLGGGEEDDDDDGDPWSPPQLRVVAQRLQRNRERQREHQAAAAAAQQGQAQGRGRGRGLQLRLPPQLQRAPAQRAITWPDASSRSNSVRLAAAGGAKKCGCSRPALQPRRT